MTAPATARNEFDPEPGAAYGRCLDCDLVLLDEAAASRHGQDTLAPTGASQGVTATGHRLRVTNPTRERRIASRVASVVDDAVVEAVNDLLALVGPGRATAEEITRAVAPYPDFAEAWQEALDENYDDDGNPIEASVGPSVPEDRLSMAHPYEQGMLFDYIDPDEETSDD